MTGSMQRTVGLGGAILLGLGSILGTGVFVSVGIVSDVAGSWTVLTIALAAIVATFNGLSSAQLAAAHPVSGGTYEYGHRYLSPGWGFSAGWMFLCAKSASAATAALGVSGYVLGQDAHPAASVLVVALVTLAVLGGLHRSNLVNAILVALTIGTLTVFCVTGLPTVGERSFGSDEAPSLLEGTALMFVAFTGYGRIATLGEEVVEPRRTIPRAVILTLIASALLYLAVAYVGGSSLAAGPAPLVETASGFGVGPIVAFGACTAMLGVLLNLILGLSRVALAMGRRGDLPASLGTVSSSGSPTIAVLIVSILIAGLSALGDVKTTWSFSAFTVLVYYAITNLAALRLPSEDRRFPRAISWLGLASCASLAFFVESEVWLGGLGVLLGGVVLRAFTRGLAGK
ncbi:MAG: APC family permease [Planctomycetota bacterium]